MLFGFSTGALARGDFTCGLKMLRDLNICAIELSALRENELLPLVNCIDSLDLSGFSYISVHAPSVIRKENEANIINQLHTFTNRGYPIVVHPDTISDFALWKSFGSYLLIENMDLRRNVGRYVEELDQIFDCLPQAGLCLDLGHSRQCDMSMTESYLFLKKFASRLGQIHLSDVVTRGIHESLSNSAIIAFREIAMFIPGGTPIILETPVTSDKILTEIERAKIALRVENN